MTSRGGITRDPRYKPIYEACRGARRHAKETYGQTVCPEWDASPLRMMRDVMAELGPDRPDGCSLVPKSTGQAFDYMPGNVTWQMHPKVARAKDKQHRKLVALGLESDCASCPWEQIQVCDCLWARVSRVRDVLGDDPYDEEAEPPEPWVYTIRSFPRKGMRKRYRPKRFSPEG